GNLLLHIGSTALWVGVGADKSAYFWLNNHRLVLWSLSEEWPQRGNKGGHYRPDAKDLPYDAASHFPQGAHHVLSHVCHGFAHPGGGCLPAQPARSRRQAPGGFHRLLPPLQWANRATGAPAGGVKPLQQSIPDSAALLHHLPDD